MSKRIILLSGMSGAGKSSVAAVLEDMGYLCVDNLPVELLDNFLEECVDVDINPRYNNVVLSVTANDFETFAQTLHNAYCEFLVVFVDASNDTLLHRYKSTRRLHPFLSTNQAATLEEAISAERALFQEFLEMPQMLIDTTFLTPTALKKKVMETLSINSKPEFSISFISFGYKNGVPMDADILIDVRFLPNPYWEADLCQKSGDNQDVYDYVMEKDITKEYMKRLESFLDYSFEQYIKEGKNHFTVGVGCTGGQHRSVAITNALFDKYSQQYRCYKSHRDKVAVYEG